MDKFENEEKIGFYYESDQDSHSSDSDWSCLQESQVSTDSSQEITSDESQESV